MMKRIANILILIVISLLSDVRINAQTAINIWEGTNNKANVKLTPYIAEGNSNPAIIVCPGGSYFWLDRKTEGHGVAQWLQSQNISAFVLEYRVGGVPAFITHYRLLSRGNRYPDMLLDVQRSIEFVRQNAETWKINPDAVGVMGFSAGGHLAALSGIYFDSNLLESQVSLKPNFIASIYPVVSLIAPCTHKRSRRGLLGEGSDISSAMKDSLSIERRVRADMPPVFLMNCVDDPIVKYQNSELFDSAMTAKGVEHKYIQYKTGGHGFGANPSKTTSEAIAWKDEFINWLKSILND